MKKQITKSYLEYLGITEVTADGRVFTKNGELRPYLSGRNKRGANQDRLTIKLHDSEKRQSIPKEKRNSSSGNVDIRLHQVVFAWFNSEIPYGKEIHHKDGNYLNNSVDNLVALTRAEHAEEHRRLKEKEMRELKCRLDIPREWYQKQLDELEAIENKTKVNYDKISNYRAKLRYYDNHIDEANKIIQLKKEIELIKYLKKEFKAKGDITRWHQFRQLEVQWATIEEKLRSQILDSVMKYCI